MAHAVEADCRNPHSTPLHASTAGGIIRKIDFEDARHPVIQKLLAWCESGAHFNGKNWNLSVFIDSRQSESYPANREAADKESESIKSTPLPDGSWAIPWGWEGFPEEWAISKTGGRARSL